MDSNQGDEVADGEVVILNEGDNDPIDKPREVCRGHPDLSGHQNLINDNLECRGFQKNFVYSRYVCKNAFPFLSTPSANLRSAFKK